MLKDAPLCLIAHLTGLFNGAYIHGYPLSHLKTLTIFPILKNPDKDHHDPLSLLFKAYESLLLPRISGVLEDPSNAHNIPNNSFGFRPEKGCRDALTCLRETILANKFDFQTPTPVYAAFLDIEKAFDRVSRPILWERLWESGIRGRLWRAARGIFSGFQGRVRANHHLTSPFSIDTGVIQGSRLGPTLFNVFFSPLLRTLNSLPGARLPDGTSLSALAYADDLVVLANSPSELQSLLDACSNFALESGFRFSATKSKVMLFNASSHTPAPNHTQ